MAKINNEATKDGAETEVNASTEVLATKDGAEMLFPKLAWDNLGANKNGWEQKVNIPKEAQ